MAGGNLVATGIAGLDDILRGGITRGNVVLLEGAAGAGKTLLGMEFVYRGVTQHNEPGLLSRGKERPCLIRDCSAQRPRSPSQRNSGDHSVVLDQEGYAGERTVAHDGL